MSLSPMQPLRLVPPTEAERRFTVGAGAPDSAPTVSSGRAS